MNSVLMMKALREIGMVPKAIADTLSTAIPGDFNHIHKAGLQRSAPPKKPCTGFCAVKKKLPFLLEHREKRATKPIHMVQQNKPGNLLPKPSHELNQ